MVFIRFLPLAGSWVVISGVISRVTVSITHITGLITPLITTYEPPSRVWGCHRGLGFRFSQGFGVSGLWL